MNNMESTARIDNLVSDNLRVLMASMVEKAKSGHPGGAMGAADFIHVLFSEFLNFDPDDMEWAFRDRFFLDPGHMSPMLYSILALTGNYSMDDLKNFRQWGSPTPGHPEVDVKRGVENTSGPLGQGHTMGVGAAIAERFLASKFGEWMSHKTFAFISDGGIQEEISQGAGRIAGHYGLNNLIMFYDSNDIQLSHVTDNCTSEDTAKKYEAWGWNVVTIDGSDHDQIRKALTAAVNETEKPSLIIGKTIMGKGAVTESGESFERMVSTHGQPISNAGASFAKTVANLGGNPEDPFAFFPEVQAHYEKVLAEKRRYAQEKKNEYYNWEKANPEQAIKLNSFLSGVMPALNYADVATKANIATRAASGNTLNYFASKFENMMVASADLSNSDKTDSFLKATTEFGKENYGGAFLQMGVAELTMAAICNGIALHGGIIPVCATFFVFSDYMKPAARMAALMELPVKYVWTHDSFRVGEDGPTHQPIEHEMQIRLLEKLQNHSGKNSMVVLRPADSAEAITSWKIAIENTKTPTALLLSRQNIVDIPTDGNRLEESAQAAKGAYVVRETGNPDLVLLANGSEVSTCYQAAPEIEKALNIKVNVVSAISEGLFSNQTAAYRETVLPAGVKRLALTAGLSDSFAGLAGADGKVVGLNHFGYSAPYTVLDEKFGFTVDNLLAQAKELMK